ncbi:6-carboxyhexanoate--CoA ligase [Bacillus sp. N1-1]|jgi:6-carboxyhexanoate--CoA ligase|uniref:6-carboxyhexanoate--CoA ligase n=1 Tax=Bacillus sp. N1-1 TaxID=2682541 RepID=UPI001318A79A|nr:6-carboxyhexanoate--CoA ligase [Bacillus sp. N1-1]QHA91147.1 6-carboxyhexanoate--CoA ligase [Bacillus sp. N1-1]
MCDKECLSIRMRASEGGAHEEGGKHISGGEILAIKSEMIERTTDLLQRAFSHQRGEPDFLQLTIEKVKEPVHHLKPLPVSYTKVKNLVHGKNVAHDLLKLTGLEDGVILKALELLEKYYDVRGAIMIDAATGERIDGRHDKGVRVSRLDWEQKEYESWLTSTNIKSNKRMKEALTLATKVSSHPDTIAELCYSDDPDYITGYVASKKIGYHRISQMKELGDENGGRIFFVRQCHVPSYIDYLEKEPILLKGV